MSLGTPENSAIRKLFIIIIIKMVFWVRPMGCLIYEINLFKWMNMLYQSLAVLKWLASCSSLCVCERRGDFVFIHSVCGGEGGGVHMCGRGRFFLFSLTLLRDEKFSCALRWSMGQTCFPLRFNASSPPPPHPPPHTHTHFFFSLSLLQS